MKITEKLRNKPQWLVFAILFLFRIGYFISLECYRSPDTWEYIANDGFAWLQGSVDRYRLPVYPMLIDICQWLSKSHFDVLLCIVQLLVSLLSVVVLYQTLKKLIRSQWICLGVTFLYGTLFAVAGWDKALLTESLSLSLTVFVIYGIVSYIQEKKYRYVWITTGCLLVGCFLRAVFAIYAGLFVGFLVLITLFPGQAEDAVSRKKARIASLKSALIAVVSVVAVLAYAGLFYVQHGAFTLSDSGLGQQLYLVLEKGYYRDTGDAQIIESADTILNASVDGKKKAELSSFLSRFYQGSDIQPEDVKQLAQQLLSMVDNTLDPSVEAELDAYLQKEYQYTYTCKSATAPHLARVYIMENYSRDRVVAFVKEAKQNHLKDQLLSLFDNSMEKYSCVFTKGQNMVAKGIVGLAENCVFFLTFSIWHSLLIAFVELLAFLMFMIKKKEINWVRLGLGVYIAATVVLSLLGTNSEFARTAQTSLPFMFVAIGLYLDWIHGHIWQKNLGNK